MRKMSNFGFSISDVSGGNEGGRNHFGKHFPLPPTEFINCGGKFCKLFVNRSVEIDVHRIVGKY